MTAPDSMFTATARAWLDNDTCYDGDDDDGPVGSLAALLKRTAEAEREKVRLDARRLLKKIRRWAEWKHSDICLKGRKDVCICEAGRVMAELEEAIATRSHS